MYIAVKKGKGGRVRRGSPQSLIVISDHTNGYLEDATRSEGCLCVGVGASSSRLKGSKGAEAE